MANDINQVTLTGRLGKDPEIKHLGNDKSVANFSIAVGESWKDKNTGDWVNKAEWVPITVWGGLVKVAEHLKKGSFVIVQGKFQTRKYTDKSGSDRYTTEVVLQGFDAKLRSLDPKPQQDSGYSNGGRREVMEQASERYANTDDSDDIPF